MKWKIYRDVLRNLLGYQKTLWNSPRHLNVILSFYIFPYSYNHYCHVVYGSKLLFRSADFHFSQLFIFIFNFFRFVIFEQWSLVLHGIFLMLSSILQFFAKMGSLIFFVLSFFFSNIYTERIIFLQILYLAKNGLLSDNNNLQWFFNEIYHNWKDNGIFSICLQQWLQPFRVIEEFILARGPSLFLCRLFYSRISHHSFFSHFSYS